MIHVFFVEFFILYLSCGETGRVPMGDNISPGKR